MVLRRRVVDLPQGRVGNHVARMALKRVPCTYNNSKHVKPSGIHGYDV